MFDISSFIHWRALLHKCRWMRRHSEGSSATWRIPQSFNTLRRNFGGSFDCARSSLRSGWRCVYQ